MCCPHKPQLEWADASCGPRWTIMMRVWCNITGLFKTFMTQTGGGGVDENTLKRPTPPSDCRRCVCRRRCLCAALLILYFDWDCHGDIVVNASLYLYKLLRESSQPP